MTIIILYVFLCLLVGWGFSDTKWGFGGGFLFSLLLSPLLGFIVMLFMPSVKDDTVQNQILINQQHLLQQQLNQSKPQTSLADQLTKLEELREKKLISQAEYDKMREKAMNTFL